MCSACCARPRAVWAWRRCRTILALRAATLPRVLDHLEGPSFTAYFVYPEELKTSKRVGVFRDFLLEKVAEQPVW